MKRLSLLWLISGLWVSTLVCGTARCESQDAGGSKSEHESGQTMFGVMTSLLSEAIGNPSSPAARRVLRAEVSSSCSLGLLRFVRALKTSEPWVLRFLDASAKFPNGLLQGTMADLGAFDECIETVIYDQFGREDIRGQYCNVDIRIVNDTSIEDYIRPAATISHRRFPIGARYVNQRPWGTRFGICMTTECSAKDMQVIADAVTNNGIVKVAIQGCVTNQHPPMDTTQTAILGFLGTLVSIVALATACDIGELSTPYRQDRFLLPSPLLPRSFLYSSQWYLFIPCKQASVYLIPLKCGSRCIGQIGPMYSHRGQANEACNSSVHSFNPIAEQVGACPSCEPECTATIAVGIHKSRYGREIIEAFAKRHSSQNIGSSSLFKFCSFPSSITVPLFFVIMCFYVVPLLLTGPNTAELYEKFYADVRHNWWALLVQGRNAIQVPDTGILWHLWYLSADFQLFIIALPVIIIFKRQPWTAIVVFLVLSVLGSSVTAWQMYNTNYDPFAFVTSDVFVAKMDMFSNVYILPSCHAVCFFAGCICQILVQKYAHFHILKVLQLFLWCLSLACCAACMFVRYFWNHEDRPTMEWVNILVAFCATPLWAIFLAWPAFACATKRGGILSHFLSWEAFTPFSRLILGVYIIHLPLHYLIYYESRERIPYLHFTLVTHTFGVTMWSYLLSYVVYLICEAPTRNIGNIFVKSHGSLQYSCDQANTCSERWAANEATQNADFSKKTGSDVKSTAFKGTDRVYAAGEKYTPL
ncbi:unnamed protein product [Ixodes persulcatus]